MNNFFGKTLLLQGGRRALSVENRRTFTVKWRVELGDDDRERERAKYLSGDGNIEIGGSEGHDTAVDNREVKIFYHTNYCRYKPLTLVGVNPNQDIPVRNSALDFWQRIV